MAIYYIETTIPSFYHEVRAEPEMVARRDWTRRWYDVAVTADRIVSSAAVLDELQRGDFPGRDDCLEMLNTTEMLELNDPVFESTSLVPSLRLPRNLELPALGKREQIWANSPSQWYTWAVHSRTSYSNGIARGDVIP